MLVLAHLMSLAGVSGFFIGAPAIPRYQKPSILVPRQSTLSSIRLSDSEDEEEMISETKRTFSTIRPNGEDLDLLDTIQQDPLPVHKAIQSPAGLLCNDHEECATDETTHLLPHRGRSRKRVLVLCTGGTLTMSHDPMQGNSLAPVQGALTRYMASMRELTDDPEMPEIVSHEYDPLIDSSDMGPGDWALVATDIATNYYHFDGENLSYH